MHPEPVDPARFDPDSADITALVALIDGETNPLDVPTAREIVASIPVYGADRVSAALRAPASERALADEWARILRVGAGAFVVRAAWSRRIVEDVGEVFLAEIARCERDAEASGRPAGADHFGSNARIWNSLEKLAVAAPTLYIDYHANETLALASRAWLGPLYQMTSQVNLVRPGGAAQVCHRDFPMGFLATGTLARFPAHQHAWSQALTLQGACAHVDVPIESGPTLLLPRSQAWLSGYLHSNDAAVQDLFERHHVQLPLAAGDALFFNPAMLHAAGHNRTRDVERLVNLFQVSAAWNRPMEVVDRIRIARHVYPELRARRGAGVLDDVALERVIACSVDGYPFPSNLELEPPIGGLAPKSQQDVLREALATGWTAAVLLDALEAQAALKRSL